MSGCSLTACPLKVVFSTRRTCCGPTTSSRTAPTRKPPHSFLEIGSVVRMTGDVAPTLHDDVVLILTRQFHVAPESVDADLLSTGTLDSLALVDLILQLEARFGV